MKKLLVTAAVLLLCTGAVFAIAGTIEDSQRSDKSKGGGLDKSAHSISQPSSIWVVVNKKHALPNSYVPAGLVAGGNGELIRNDVFQNLNKLIRSGASQSINLRVISGYRSYDYQAGVYDSFAAQDGQKAESYSARPGYSEHQTGLAADLGNSDGACDLDKCFGETASGRWLAVNAHKYGFIIRYQAGKENITGYQAEPWHLRYVGKELAAELKRSNQTLEEFFMLPPAPSY